MSATKHISIYCINCPRSPQVTSALTCKFSIAIIFWWILKQFFEQVKLPQLYCWSVNQLIWSWPVCGQRLTMQLNVFSAAQLIIFRNRDEFAGCFLTEILQVPHQVIICIPLLWNQFPTAIFRQSTFYSNSTEWKKYSHFLIDVLSMVYSLCFTRGNGHSSLLCSLYQH